MAELFSNPPFPVAWKVLLKTKKETNKKKKKNVLYKQKNVVVINRPALEFKRDIYREKENRKCYGKYKSFAYSLSPVL